MNHGGAPTAAGTGHSQGKAMAAITNPAWLLQGTACSVCTTSVWGKNWEVTPCHQVLGLLENLSFYHERYESNRIAVASKELEGPSVHLPFLSMAGSREKKTCDWSQPGEKQSMCSLVSKDLAPSSVTHCIIQAEGGVSKAIQLLQESWK